MSKQHQLQAVDIIMTGYQQFLSNEDKIGILRSKIKSIEANYVFGAIIKDKDQKRVDKLQEQIAAVGSLQGIFSVTMEKLQMVAESKINEVPMHAIKTSLDPEDVSEYLNEMTEQFEIISRQYFTGTDGDQMVTCVAIEYVEKYEG